MMKADELANSLQVCLDSGAKKVLLPITSAEMLPEERIMSAFDEHVKMMKNQLIEMILAKSDDIDKICSANEALIPLFKFYEFKT